MDPFRQLRSGEVIPGLPHEPWNQMLDGLKPGTRTSRAQGGPETAIEFDVKNTTANVVQRFGILATTSPLISFEDNNDLFFDQDTLNGIAPSSSLPFVVTQRSSVPGDIVPARLLGQTRVRVNLTSTSHRYADPTTDTTKLTSGASGSARILWTESNFASTGDQWAVVNLLGQSAGGASIVSIGQSTIWPGGYFVQPNTDSGFSGTGMMPSGNYTLTANVFTSMNTVGTNGAFITLKMYSNASDAKFPVARGDLGFDFDPTYRGAAMIGWWPPGVYSPSYNNQSTLMFYVRSYVDWYISFKGRSVTAQSDALTYFFGSFSLIRHGDY